MFTGLLLEILKGVAIRFGEKALVLCWGSRLAVSRVLVAVADGIIAPQAAVSFTAALYMIGSAFLHEPMGKTLADDVIIIGNQGAFSVVFPMGVIFSRAMAVQLGSPTLLLISRTAAILQAAVILFVWARFIQVWLTALPDWGLYQVALFQPVLGFISGGFARLLALIPLCVFIVRDNEGRVN